MRRSDLLLGSQSNTLDAMRKTVLLSLLVIAALAIAGGACKSSKKSTSVACPTPGASTPAKTPAAAGGPPAVSALPTVTSSCLQIIDVTVGTGAAAKSSSTLSVNYTGWLEDGTKFDASADHGGPAIFPLDQVIPGWREGMPGMKVGGKRRLIVPPDLGYGAAGRPPVIPANATLIFDIELLSVQ